MRIKNIAELEKLLANKQPKGQEYLILKKDSTQNQTTVSNALPAQSRIIGLDVALRCTGWGIIDMRRNPFKQTAVDCGVIKNTPKEKVSQCLKRLAEATRELVTNYKPTIAVLEGGFYGRNVRTAVALGAARGAVIATLAMAGIPVFEYAPRRVKQAVCGFGNASKEQVARLVSQLLGIRSDNLMLDSTDALAMALCHAQSISRVAVVNPPEEI